MMKLAVVGVDNKNLFQGVKEKSCTRKSGDTKIVRNLPIQKGSHLGFYNLSQPHWIYVDQ